MVHRVVIFKHGQNFKVIGGQLAVKMGDSVEFYNSTGAGADVSFDDKKLPGGNFALKNGNKHRTKVDKKGWYPYTVTVKVVIGKKEKKHKAEASKPIVIVYP